MNASSSSPESHDRTWSRTGGSVLTGSVSVLRVPGLTVLYHPEIERVGERTLLPGLAGGAVEVSRHRPHFAASGGESSRPLDDPGLSRTPLVLRREGEKVVVDCGTSRTRVMLDGREVHGRASVAAEALEGGVVVLLGGRVVLLLHLLEPVADGKIPRFGMVGESPALNQVRREIVQTADLAIPILLRGESGTGKELVARAVHDAGPRRERSYVTINMAAVPPSLAAAELFGAERGAYTGSDRRRRGLFGQAQGGSLFLDEVGEAPLEVQALLLRALETGEVRRVGGEQAEPIDVRIISATDAHLEAAIAAERFRGPLLHRLSGYVIRLPALRERREDFGRLFAFFLRRELAALGNLEVLENRRRPWIAASLVARLAAWHWPGNVRQLANVVRQLVIANRGADRARRVSEVEALIALDAVESSTASAAPTSSTTGPLGAFSGSPPPAEGRKPSDLTEEEVVSALRVHRFRPAAAADALGLPRSSIYTLIDKIPGLRKASELTREQIAAAREEAGPSVEAMAARLEVSERALRRRLGELDAD